MGEFATMSRKRAAAALVLFFQQEGMPMQDPLLELIGWLLTDETTAILQEGLLETEAILTWNRLALGSPKQLLTHLMEVLEAEQVTLPMERDTFLNWVSSMVQLTLDRMQLM